MTQQKIIIIMAGGTGGHVFPALAVAEKLRALGVAVHWLGTAPGLEARIVPKDQIPLHFLRVKGLRGQGWKRLLLMPFMLTSAVVQAMRTLLIVKPDCVLGMGGYVAGPGALAAWILRIPVVIHEQNAVAGLTNRYLRPFAKQVLLAYPNRLLQYSHARLVGNPLREPFLSVSKPEVRYKQRTGPLHLLVVGGSQGARVLNECVPHALSLLDEASRPVVWHQTGRVEYEKTAADYQAANVQAQVSAFIEDMVQAYEWADLVICRAGAMTVSEISAVGVAALFVPYPYAVDDHQTANAQYLISAEAAELMLELEMDASRLASKLVHLLSSRQNLLEMAKKAQALAKLTATDKVVEALKELGGE